MIRRLRDAAIVLALGVVLLLALEWGARAFGLGDLDLPPRAPGRFRILALGGSTVLGVPDGAQGFMAQLERQLRRAANGRPLEVLNLARSGVGSRTVRATLERALDPPPDLVIVLTGHNEFLEPLPGPLQTLRDRSRLVAALAARLAPEPEAEPPLPAQLHAVDPGGEEARTRRRAFEANLEAVVGLAGEAGVPLLLVTAPSNLADWSPAWRRVEGALDEEEALRLRRLLAHDPPETALAAVREARSARPEDPMLMWLEGRALRALGRLPEAREHFVRARALDPVPRRAFDGFNDFVRGLAERPGVRVVDAAKRFDAHAEGGLVGFDLIGDNCHPTPLGNALIAREIALDLREAGLFLPPDAPVPDLDGFVAQLQRDLGGAEERRLRRVRWLLSNAIYAMKTPFFHYEVSQHYLRQARKLAPRDWRVYANLGTLSLLAGNLELGRVRLSKAAAFKGGPLDPQDRNVVPYLAEALAGAGLALDGPTVVARPDAGGS